MQLGMVLTLGCAYISCSGPWGVEVEVGNVDHGNAEVGLSAGQDDAVEMAFVG
jgi:hypothetical protein